MAPHFKSLRKEGSHDIRNGRKVPEGLALPSARKRTGNSRLYERYQTFFSLFYPVKLIKIERMALKRFFMNESSSHLLLQVEVTATEQNLASTR